MDETSITSKDRGLTPKSRSEEDNDVNTDSKDVQGTDQNSARDPNQIIIEYLLARVPVFRDLVEVRDRVSWPPSLPNPTRSRCIPPNSN